VLIPLGAGQVDRELNGNKVASVCPRGVINKPGILECPRSSLGPWPNKWRAHARPHHTNIYIYIYIYTHISFSLLLCV